MNDISVVKIQSNIKLLKPGSDQAMAKTCGLSVFPDPDKYGFEADLFWMALAYPRQIAFVILPRLQDKMCEMFRQTIETCDCTHLTDTDGKENECCRYAGWPYSEP